MPYSATLFNSQEQGANKTQGELGLSNAELLDQKVYKGA